MDRKFSNETKVVITMARDIAIDLGSELISTIHFYLANCKLEGYFNPKEFLFQSEEEFEQFYESLRIINPNIINNDNISLTLEAEETIRQSLKLKKEIKSDLVQPTHILLAATKVPNSLFLTICNNKKDVYYQLLEFYIKKGYIIDPPITSFITKIKKSILGHFN